MTRLRQQLKRLVDDEEGQVALEYFLLVIAGVAAGLIIIPPIARIVGQLFQAGVVAEITKPFH
jgi:hypothetical protein